MSYYDRDYFGPMELTQREHRFAKAWVLLWVAVILAVGVGIILSLSGVA